jgi:putative SOS response-associated peptidase YedK
MLAQLSPGAASILPMCGRYASFLPAEAIARIFGTVNPLPNLAPSWNVAPTQDAAVVRRHRETGQRHLDLLKWGLLPYWTKEPTRAQRPINARSETAAKLGVFKDSLARRRCLVPADAFYEWKVIEGGKQPYAVARQDGQPMPFAGLWESFRWPDETVTRSFTIMTTTPNGEMAELHDRMPVILQQADWPVWLGEGDGDHAALLRPAPDGLLRIWPVDRRVGSPRNNGPELLASIDQDVPQGRRRRWLTSS